MDSTGKFTLQPFQNNRNDGIWAEDSEAILPFLIHAPTNKFQKGIIFWSVISSNGLIPTDAPVNYLYSKFLTKEATPAINKIFESTDVIPIFQDDQDNKHRTTLVQSTVADLFNERIEPRIGDTKFAAIWPVEKVWGEIKETLRGQEFDSEVDLQKEIAHHWNRFAADKCRPMMEKIPKHLKLVTDTSGEQIFGD